LIKIELKFGPLALFYTKKIRIELIGIDIKREEIIDFELKLKKKH